MGKTIKPRKLKKVEPGAVIVLHSDPNITQEQRQKNQAAIKWFQQRLDAAERMTPEQRRQADEDWETLKAAVNEARGRKVIGDD